MDRLTQRGKQNGHVYFTRKPKGFLCKQEFCNYAYKCEYIKDRTCPYLEVMDRLAAIEDIFGDNYDLDRLKWLIQADKNGMFVAVPCKVGDTVYVITNKDGCMCCGKEIVKCEVNTMRVKSDGITIGYSCRGKYGNGNNYIGNFVFKSIGKTVFLTREAADEALKGKQNG